MLTFYPNKQSNLPLYRQLYLFIKMQIQTRQLQTFEKMPSKRALANHLKLSQVTIDTAYQQLVVEGYLKARPKSGFYVEPYDQPIVIKKELVKPSYEPKKQPQYEYAFQTNVIDESLFPNQLYAKTIREVLSQQQIGANRFETKGIEKLREEIAKYLNRFRGIVCHSDQIVIGAGTESLLALLIPLLGTKLHYAMENPGYPKIAEIFHNWNIAFSPIDLDEFGLKVEDLTMHQVDSIHVTPSHQFPMGIVMPLQRRLELLNWAKQSAHRYIIEDDYDSEFRYVGQPIPALQSLDHFDKVIYMNSFSKSLAPSLRINYMVLPKSLVEPFHKLYAHHSCAVSYLDQLVLAKFMEAGHFERHLNQMRKIYRTRLETFQKTFVFCGFDQVFTLSGFDAGLHFLMVAKTLDEDLLTTMAKEHGILIRGLREFMFRPVSYPSTLVIGYSGLQDEQIIVALKKLRHIWASFLT